MVKGDQSADSGYRPVQAVSVTGLFPGFARPHFLPEHVSKSSWNTVYVQCVSEEEIISFEPLEEGFVGAFSLPQTDRTVRRGDEPTYVYAFGPEDAVVGTRSVISAAIEKRFDEIASKEFAACTAAQFARLKNRLPDVNRRAFELLFKFNAASAHQWRDTAIFLSAIKDEFRSFGIPSDAISLKSRIKDRKLEVTLALSLDPPHPDQRVLEKAGKQLLLGSDLFSRGDLFTLDLRSSAGDRATSQLRLFEAGELDDALGSAKKFIEQSVFSPALGVRRPSIRTINVIRDTRQWISKFHKIGDLVRYMERFEPDLSQASLPLMEIKQIRFEDVHTEFLKQFGRYRGFQTTSADFLEGERYSPFSLSIYTRTYNNRGGGIRPVGKIGSHKAVVVNVTLGGGKYANEWLTPGRKLKCYLRVSRRRSSQPDENSDANRSIMKYPHVPILLFTREPGERDFLYSGIFRYTKITADGHGHKWFELTKRSAA
jgi:hypothetical protein